MDIIKVFSTNVRKYRLKKRCHKSHWLKNQIYIGHIFVQLNVDVVVFLWKIYNA